MENVRIVSPKEIDNEKELEINLRPNNFEEFVGQRRIKENLKIAISASKKRKTSLDHILFYGPPGLGKTTLAYIIAKSLKVNIKVTSGPAIEKAGDLAAILTNLKQNDILFIDEIHRLNKTIEEVLYPALEEFKFDIIIGKGPSARILRLKLPKFTLIGATTRLSLLSSPLRDRFGMVLHLDFYEDEEIFKILKRSASILNIKTEENALFEIAKRSRKTPRVANRLLKRVRDYSEVKANGIITFNTVLKAFELLEIDELGLDKMDRTLLNTIIEKFNGGPVGLNTLSAATSEEIDTIEEIYEPFLMRIGLLERTPRGRTVTKKAYEHLGISSNITSNLFNL